MLADGSATGRADPAFDAHEGPIGSWAMAIWEGWLPREAQTSLFNFARRKLARAKSIWSACAGAGAGFVATADRLGWNLVDAFTIEDDAGQFLDMRVTPPAAVINFRQTSSPTQQFCCCCNLFCKI